MFNFVRASRGRALRPRAWRGQNLTRHPRVKSCPRAHWDASSRPILRFRGLQRQPDEAKIINFLLSFSKISAFHLLGGFCRRRRPQGAPAWPQTAPDTLKRARRRAQKRPGAGQDSVDPAPWRPPKAATVRGRRARGRHSTPGLGPRARFNPRVPYPQSLRTKFNATAACENLSAAPGAGAEASAPQPRT